MSIDGIATGIRSSCVTAAAIVVLLTAAPASAACLNVAGVTKCSFSNLVLTEVGEELTIREFGDPSTGPHIRILLEWIDDTLESDPIFSTCGLRVEFSGDPEPNNGQLGIASANHAQGFGTSSLFQFLSVGDTALLVERAGAWFNADDNCEAGIVFSFARSGRADRLFRR